MPKLNGLDIARSLLRQDPKIKILMLSMYKELRHIEEFKRLGVKGYLLKTAKITEYKPLKKFTKEYHGLN
jgi:DNA-binding NarL/FixJ family response regulator